MKNNEANKEVQDSKELFTGGEWQKDGLAVVSSLSERLEICVVTSDNDIHRKEAEANARLIVESKNMRNLLLRWAQLYGDPVAYNKYAEIAWNETNQLLDRINNTK